MTTENPQDSRKCPRCGRPIAPDAPEGLCAACLVGAGMENVSGSLGDETTRATMMSGSASGSGGPRLTAGQTWGPYRIGRLLGRGGMGEVYEAESLENGRRLALKLLRSRLEKAEDRARFLREGQLAASISHPHTVYIFGSEEIDGVPVISMELLPGGTLKERVASSGPMPWAEAVAAVMDIIGGLDAAQAAGVLHRDIKPSNCFIDEDGAVKVGDFGLSISTLARDVHHDLEAGAFQGTPQFAPPEQLRGEPLDIRADIYAVGATLYYLLTGRPPFDAADLRELVSRVTTESPVSLRSLRREIPAALAAVVLQCLAKVPGERPKAYADLAAALRPFLPAADSPARLGTRFLAGVADSGILGFPILMATFLVTRALGQPTTDNPAAFWSSLVVSFLYGFVLESLYGATWGEMLFSIRVRSADGARAPWWRILIRMGILTAVAALQAPIWKAGEAAGFATGTIAIGSTAIVSAATAAMFLTARSHNGYASLYDLISGTRVRIFSKDRGRRRMETVAAASRTEGAESYSGEQIGPFTVIATIGTAGTGRLLAGYDPVLRRRVWILAVPPGTPPVSPARRDISRVTRLHWLTGRRSATENWDAFEAPSGGPLLKRNEASLDWPAARAVLADLLHEFDIALKEGSLPPLGLDRLWMRADGRTVLLDFEAPGMVASPSSANASPTELLAAVAARVTMPGALSNDLTSRLPLSASVLLRRWSREAPRSLEEARAQLREAAASPERLSPLRRAIPIAVSAMPFLFIGLSSLVMLPNADVLILTREDREVIALLTMLESEMPPGSPLSSPEYRRAVETYLAGQHGELLRNPNLWSGPSQGTEGDRPELRQLASDIATRYPAVTAEELARSLQTIQPTLDRVRPPESLNVASPGVIVLNLMVGMASVLVLLCSIVSSIAVPGGIATRLTGLAVVNREGKQIGRGRSLMRTLITWAPALVWLMVLPNPVMMGFGPASPLPLLATCSAFAAMIAGVVWTLAATDRGLQDRIAGTWVVPR